ncbi:MAG TPA: DUF6580 family putative transport protein [Bacteroidota bacterium]|nr:DUF6580 family putative transport protein [Bacteroidota bacterium]
MKKASMIKYAAAFVLIFAAALSRLVPHLPNFTPLAAIALFGGFYLDKKFALVAPLAAMLVSDYFIGFSSDSMFVYGSLLAIGAMALAMQHRKSALVVAGTTLAGSVLFFVVTNFGIWATQTWYPRTAAGLVECFTMALPFFRNTVAGDAFYVAAMFGIYEAVLMFADKADVKTVRVSA